ncbi:hypothetical protein [Paenibacillus durus]|uniref:Tail assembly chaperone n=1 Tax=Paenibacillus durus ATCC 35681 TaxID=1333534 RepID=A0A0F7FBM9_PAEDU|nr:hypothetical protein [Paenibacillus durus]AKG36085.1 hypothetical protein VK70_17245 [Paenibacillus durus ATCC 35681]
MDNKEQNIADIGKKVAAGGKLNEAEVLDFESAEGNRYKGVLVFKKPTMADLMKIGGLKSEFLRTAGVQDARLVDNDILFTAHMLATLEVVLVKRPEFLFKLNEVKESDLIFHVYGKYQVWEASFRKEFRDAPKTDRPASEGEEALDTP